MDPVVPELEQRRHAVVMDLGMRGLHGVAALLELRDNRIHTGLPVLAVTHDGLNAKEREIVDELATVHAPMDGASGQLGKLLDVSFPLAATSDVEP